ncbi:MAG TPA: hypothetical protein VG148_15675, partial [Pyrinomonadaceae bacterium]|nr:hypothetical protein [Pyrinomonadaceae bacterium]
PAPSKPAAGRAAKRRAAEAPAPDQPDTPDLDFDPEADPALADRDWVNRPMTDAELREVMRRTAEARRHADRERLRILREQRRNRRRIPPPPPPQP